MSEKVSALQENNITAAYEAKPTSRSSCLQMFFKIGALKNFAIFPGKHR